MQYHTNKKEESFKPIIGTESFKTAKDMKEGCTSFMTGKILVRDTRKQIQVFSFSQQLGKKLCRCFRCFSQCEMYSRIQQKCLARKQLTCSFTVPCT